MTPFQEFRLWARRAPRGERTAAAVASLLVLAVLAWVLVPSNGAVKGEDALVSSGVPTATAPAVGPGADAPPVSAGPGVGVPAAPGVAVGGIGGGTASGASSGGGTAGSSTTGGKAAGTGGKAPGVGGNGAAACPAGSGPGLTTQRLKLAVILVSIAGPAANSVFGIASPEDQRNYYNAVAKDLNARGGVGCRQLVLQFYEGNPADQNQLQSLCIDLAEADIFAVLDAGAYSRYPLVSCFAQKKVPYFGSYLLAGTLQAKWYPYLFNFNTLDVLYRDTVFGLNTRGFYSAANGFKKLGFIYRCADGIHEKYRSWLRQVGVAGDELVTYDTGCPSGAVPPSEIQQAVLKFQQAGVTHVSTVNFVGDFVTFTRVAQQQRYKPKYGLSDDSLIAVSTGAQAPDPDNIDGAVAITASRSAENTTPGIKMSSGSARCSAVLKQARVASVYQSPAIAGNSCSNTWMFAAAAGHAPALRRDALAAGLQAARSVDFSFPQGPNDFTGQRITTGGQFWRPAQFSRSCTCWRVLDTAFKKTFG